MDQLHPLWESTNLRRALHAAGVALWSWRPDTDRFTMDERAFELWCLPHTNEVKFEDLSAHIHPADRDRVRAAFTATLAIVGPTKSISGSWLVMSYDGYPLGD